DGHDAAINIMRRILQSSGAEIIHLGHNRSVQDIVNTAIQEDAQAIAITSYQGGHVEFFKYMYDLLKEKGAGHIKLFGGGGGTILPSEIEELHAYGISRIYSPDDGRMMGLQGMINDLLELADFPTGMNLNGEMTRLEDKNPRDLGKIISAIENESPAAESALKMIEEKLSKVNHSPVLGITGTGGAGKSSLIDEFIRRFLREFEDKTLAIISVDPSKRKTGGALLGDRIRMNSVNHPRVYMRSLATRQSNLALSQHVHNGLNVLKAAQFDLIILETSGIGQSDTEIIDHSDVSLYVMTPEYGAATQLEKIDMLDYADLIALNKFDKRGAHDALRDVRKQYRRNHRLWETSDDNLPVFGTIASQFNDPGMNRLYHAVMNTISEKTGADLHSKTDIDDQTSEKIYIIPPSRVRYLSEITESIRNYNQWVETQASIARKLEGLTIAKEALGESSNAIQEIDQTYEKISLNMDKTNQVILDNWETKKARYAADEYVYQVRGKDIRVKTYTKSLSHNRIPKVVLPSYKGWGDILKWNLQENVPGEFPFTAGVFPFKREKEDPTRMFAGEGGPERTNKRFHYVSLGMPAKRLSTAFDSVTLYGEDPDHRPDIYGKIGNSGVSVSTLDAAKKLYSGFNLCDPTTSVSMTINGPAATVLGFFMNA
ncbi:MAG: methylmalonyl-CoA mutase family protein, partial [Bacteroidetes bacterium]|nr:methylmalonyl-CoA mutase family protein [Bacteroidota bacterium]